MSRKRLVQSAVVTAGLLLAGQWALAFPLESLPEAALHQDPAPPQREPLKVGGSVMAAKLITRVDPVFPEAAKQARVQGVVFLKINVNEQGEVWDTEVVRGHPLLNQAAIDAVSQWVYSPVLLNGEPVPVQATITVHFRLHDVEGGPTQLRDLPGIRLTIDQRGDVWQGDEQLSDGDLDRLGQQEGRVLVIKHPDAPGSAVQRVSQRVKGAVMMVAPPNQTMATLLIESSHQALQSRLGSLSGAAVFVAYLDGKGNVEGLEYLNGPQDPELQDLATAQLRVYLSQQRKLSRPAVSMEATELYVALVQRP